MPDPIQKGSLRDISFAKVFFAIAGQGRSGVLEIVDEADNVIRKRLYYLGGDSSFVTFGPVHESIGQLLVANGVITEETLEDAIDQAILSQCQLGKVLVDNGRLSTETLHEYLVRQVYIKTISCFAYEDAVFRFQEESIAKFSHDVPMYKIIPERIVFDGVNQHFSIPKLEREFEHLKGKGIKLAANFSERLDRLSLPADELKVIDEIGSGAPFGLVLGKSDLGLTRTLKLLYALMVIGMVEATELKSIAKVQVKEPETIRRKPKTIELEDLPESKSAPPPAKPRIDFKDLPDLKDPAAPESPEDDDLLFSDVVTGFLSDKMKDEAKKGELVKYDDRTGEIEVSRVQQILRDNKKFALDAYTGSTSGALDSASKLGEIFVQSGAVELPALQKAYAHMREHDSTFLNSLVATGAIHDEDLHDLLSEHYKVPAVKLSEMDLDQEIVSLIPEELAKKYRAIPINRTGRTMVVAMADPGNMEAIDQLKFLLDLSNIEIVVTTDAEIKAAIDKFHDSSEFLDDVMSSFDDSEINVATYEDDFDANTVSSDSETAPVVKLVNQILMDALRKGASDIHFEPYETSFRIRYRIDGVLYHVINPPMKLRTSMVSRVKILAKLDISERRLPQDGRVTLKMGKKKIDFRVSTLPTLWGEKMVMRILDKESLQLDLTKLGMEAKQLEDLRWALYQPYGMVLVTGPSGSGKTTTLYSALIEMNKVSENICSAEDPIEYYLEGINQVQMHDEVGLNFAFCLRSFLRQDPDIIMVGEIRDFETAEIAVKAALTGHVVLTTVHTNDAPSTINRLLNMGVEPFLICASVTGVLSQRLVRKLCQDCHVPDDIDRDALMKVGVTPEEVDNFHAFKVGACPNCNERGYKGRLGLYEVMTVKGELTDFILGGATPTELKHEAMRMGMRTMRMCGLGKVNQGLTTIAEVTRTTMPDFQVGRE